MNNEQEKIKLGLEFIQDFARSKGIRFAISDDGDHLTQPNPVEIRKQLDDFTRTEIVEKLARQWGTPVKEAATELSNFSDIEIQSELIMSLISMHFLVTA